MQSEVKIQLDCSLWRRSINLACNPANCFAHRQGRQGLEHVHRPAAVVVHARWRSRTAHGGWRSAGLYRRRPPRPGHHAHATLLRQRSAAGRRRLPRSLRRLLSGDQPESRRDRDPSHRARRAASPPRTSRGVR